MSNKLSLSKAFSPRVWSTAEFNLGVPRVYKGNSRCQECQSLFHSKGICALGSRKISVISTGSFGSLFSSLLCLEAPVSVSYPGTYLDFNQSQEIQKKKKKNFGCYYLKFNNKHHRKCGSFKKQLHILWHFSHWEGGGLCHLSLNLGRFNW